METMRQRKSHIAPLVFLMLVIFVSPVTIKALHYHPPEPVHAFYPPQGTSVAKAAADCVVCQFEFVTYIACNIPEFHHFTRFASIHFCESTCDLKGSSFTYYSLRAPPVY